MIEDFSLSQGEGLATVRDLAMQGGICFALTTEWAFLLLEGKSFEPLVVEAKTWKQKGKQGKFQTPELSPSTVTVQKGFFSLVSRQRGYDLVDLKLAAHMKPGSQDQFFKIAWEFSRDFLVSLCRSNHRTVTVTQKAKGVDELDLSFDAGQCQLIGIFGVENNSNWGHVVGIGSLNRKAVYFDSNDGQYSKATKTEVCSDLKSFYTGIKNCVLYTIT